MEMAFWRLDTCSAGYRVGLIRQPREQRHQRDQRQTRDYGATPSYEIFSCTKWYQSEFTEVDRLQKFPVLQYCPKLEVNE